MITRQSHNRREQQRAVTVVTVAVTLVMLVGFAALTLDVGLMFNTKAESQRSADAAAMAGTIALINPNRLRGEAEQNEVIAYARAQTGALANQNEVNNLNPTVESSDTLIGYLRNPYDPNEPMDFSNPSRFNAVRTVVRRDDIANGPIDLLFAPIFGRDTATVTAEATAAMLDGIVGYKVTEQTGNAGLLPITLKVTAWANLLNGSFTTGDHYAYNPSTNTVSPGPDGVLELNLYPGAGATQLPPGNFGTVDIGSSDNSTNDISRQILNGVSAEDLAYFGGELRFGPDGTLDLSGDTGLSAAIAADLQAIIGQPRAIPLFTTVSGNGENAVFTINGFAGIRVMHVKLTGAMIQKKVIIQPGPMVDDATIVDVANGTSYYVYQPVRLVR